MSVIGRERDRERERQRERETEREMEKERESKHWAMLVRERLACFYICWKKPARPPVVFQFSIPQGSVSCSKGFKIAEIHKNREVIGHPVLYSRDLHQAILYRVLFNTIQKVSKTVHSLSKSV